MVDEVNKKKKSQITGWDNISDVSTSLIKVHEDL
jgi:hypothetical protein